MPTNPIDPRDFGNLEAEVKGLRRDLDASTKAISTMSRQMDDLTALANKSKGGFWAGMAMISAISAGMGFVLDHWLK